MTSGSSQLKWFATTTEGPRGTKPFTSTVT